MRLFWIIVCSLLAASFLLAALPFLLAFATVLLMEP